MSCKIPEVVEDYLRIVEGDEPKSCRYQKALAQYIRKVFNEESLIVDEIRLEKYLGLAKYLPYELFPWEKCLTALWLCTFSAPGVPRWKVLLCFVGRGAGKDGFITFLAECLVSPYNPVSHYNVDIVANNEDQALTPLIDLTEALENPKYEAKLKRHFYHTKELVQGVRNRGVIRARANNPKGRDGLRPGCVFFNEVHAYENYANIDVFQTALGKVAEPRMGMFSSNGDVPEGVFDDKLELATQILFEGMTDNGTLPFVCMLDKLEDVHKEENWYMANPSLQYRPHLLTEIRDEYRAWVEHPEQNGSFITKRMGIRHSIREAAVTDYEKIKATKKPLPDLSGWACVAGIDYAEFSDWASIVLHFRRGDERYDIHHSWLCLQSKTLSRVRAPWQEWAAQGFITLVDEPTISPRLITAYITEAARKYQIKKIAMDHFRWTAMSEAMKAIGFEPDGRKKVKLVRPNDIMQIDPVIQLCFDQDRFTWGDDPVLRWAANNVKRVRSSKKIGSDTGNFYYAKIEAKSRKTDPFMALAAAMIIENELGTGQPGRKPKIGAIAV